MIIAVRIILDQQQFCISAQKLSLDLLLEFQNPDLINYSKWIYNDFRTAWKNDGNCQNISVSVKEPPIRIDDIRLNNPVDDILNIDLQSVSGIKEVRIYSMDGKLTNSAKIQGSPFLRIDMSNLLCGVYVAQFITSNGQTGSKKILKR